MGRENQVHEDDASIGLTAALPRSSQDLGGESAEHPAALRPGYDGTTYYDVPPVRHSHYEWRTATAFFLNGVGAGSQILATLIEQNGEEQDMDLVRVGRALALACCSVSTLTLISSLHNPSRWYNMLRIYKPTSPMSIGIWAIAPFNMMSALSLTGNFLERTRYGKVGRLTRSVFGMTATMLAPFVISYMGTELEETNMPVWAAAYPLLSPVYAATGMANSAAALQIASLVTGGSKTTARVLKRCAVLFGATELFLGSVLDRRWSSQGEAKGFARSPFSTMYRIGCIGAGSAALLARLSTTTSKSDDGNLPDSITSALKLSGGLLTQMALVYAGRESGLHARDYFEYTRIRAKRDQRRGSAEELEKTGQHRNGERVPSVAHRESAPSPGRLLGVGVIALGLGFLAGSLKKRTKGDT